MHALTVSSSSGKRSAEGDLEPFASRCKMQKDSLITELRRRMDGVLDEDVIAKAVNIANIYPMLLGSDVSSIQTSLRALYDNWTSPDLINIAHAMSQCKRQIKDSTITALDNLSEKLAVATPCASRRAYDKQVRNAFSFQDKGMAMMKASVRNEIFPQPLEVDKAETIWPKADWDRFMSEEESTAAATGNKFRQDKVIQELLKHAKFSQYEFEFTFTGDQPTKAVGGFKPDLTLALKGLAITPYTVGALISLTSKAGARYDNKEEVGALCRCGEVLLKRAGPVRKSILLGISNLKMIRFFLLTFRQDSTHTGNPFVASSSQCTPTASVRLSLCGLVAIEHSTLGIDDSSPIYHLKGSPWQANRFLGTGATSNVYEVEKDNQICALKMPVVGNVLDNDATYLTQLQDVDGIPRLVEIIDTMLVLEPVGKGVDKMYDMTEASVNLGELVDVLHSAHEKNVVNRDVRKENIMIGKSLEKKSMDRLFLLDWGFATICAAPDKFQGSTVTASDEVLRQIGDGLPVVYRFVDDLVALVRCTYLLCHPELVDHVYNLSIDGCRIFWKQKMQEDIWSSAEAAAMKCDYTVLGSLLTDIQNLF